MKADDAKRLKELELEDARLKLTYSHKHKRCAPRLILVDTVGIWLVSEDRHKPIPNGT